MQWLTVHRRTKTEIKEYSTVNFSTEKLIKEFLESISLDERLQL